MHLYTFDNAPNPARLKMFMDYKGITLDTTQINLGTEEQLGADYRAIVPEATVPALVLNDGSVLCAVIAIVHYLESLYPERPLLGSTAEERAHILNWNHRLFTDIFNPVAEAFRNGHPKYVNRALPGPADIPQLPELVARGKTRLLSGLTMLDEALVDRPFLAGDALSFADIDLLAALDFAAWGARTVPDESLVNLTRWRNDAKIALTG